tara:strand:- start:4739 stop:5587 length:849 start_codon:yes stop_codon:yes gene_type:complete
MVKVIKKISVIYSTSKTTKNLLTETQEIINEVGSNLINSYSVNEITSNTANKNLSNSDLILVIGGDGTMLGSIRELNNLKIPFLGINVGRVGFLTDINPRNLSSLKDILRGDYTKEKRPIFKAFFSKSNQDIFINEVVIHSGSVAKMVDLEIGSEKNMIYKLRADGLIISSSTGSTAYSYSGGGPILSPEVNALSLLPMFSHSSSSHSLIVSSENIIKVKMKGNDSNNFDIVVDGKKNLSYSKSGLEISNTKKYFYLYHPKDYNYFHACRTKLGWAVPIENL